MHATSCGRGGGGGVTSAESNVVASDWLHMLRLSLC